MRKGNEERIRKIKRRKKREDKGKGREKNEQQILQYNEEKFD